MRTEIDLQVMQEIGAITRSNGSAIEPLSLEIEALLEALRLATPKSRAAGLTTQQVAATCPVRSPG